MLTLYVYEIDTNTVVAKIHGDSNKACEAKMAEIGYTDTDTYGACYSDNGLADADAVKEYDA